VSRPGASERLAAVRLKALSSDLLSVPEGDLRRDARLVEDLGLDSLAAIEWGMAIEDEFEVALPDDAWTVTTSYGAVEDLLAGLLAVQAPDAQAADGQAPDAQAPDAQAPDAQAPDAQAPDAQAPDAQP